MKRPFEQLGSLIVNSGVEGLVTAIDSPNQRLLNRLLIAIDRRFIGFAQLARYFASLEKQVNERSLPNLANDLLEYLAIEVHSNQQFEEFSQSDRPCILMGINHESIVEPVYIISLIDRNDIGFFGMAVTQYLGKRIAEYIFPVMPKKRASDYQRLTKPSISDRLNWAFWLYSLEDRTVEEVEHLNRNSIERAAGHINSGGILMIFPGGGVEINRPWYRGLGEILSLVSTEILREMPIFPIGASGLSRRQLYIKVNQAAFDRRRPCTIQVNVLDPIYIPPRSSGYSAPQLLEYVKEEAVERCRSR
jgi:hypothetical protein